MKDIFLILELKFVASDWVELLKIGREKRKIEHLIWGQMKLKQALIFLLNITNTLSGLHDEGNRKESHHI